MFFPTAGKRRSTWFLVATLSVMVVSGFCLVSKGTAAATPVTDNTNFVSSSNLGEFSPTFAGPAATGCEGFGCSLLTGPFFSSSVEALVEHSAVTSSQKPRALPFPGRPLRQAQPLAGIAAAAAAAVQPPSVSCEPLGPGCDIIDSSPEGAVGVKGLNAVDSAELYGFDVEPADQGLCAGNGYVVEANNIGEILVFNTALQRKSAVISLDSLMGLTQRGWHSGGDVSCLYDQDNGGHFFFTEIVSAPGEFGSGYYEGIAVSKGSSPFGPYAVYFLNANYNPDEPGYPYLLNDFAKIATTRDAFLIFYDEFPLNGGGLGGGFFNGSQEFAFNKNAFEKGLPVTGNFGEPNPAFTVAIENMGLLPTPNGTCFSDNKFHLPSVTCWFAAIPAQAPDRTQFDNSHGGSGFMLDTLDFYGTGDNRIAVFDWTGLANLNKPDCSTCYSDIKFGGQLFSGVKFYYGEGFVAAQKKGPIPLGNQCGAAGLSVGNPPPAHCPENGIATNGDFMTQVSQAQHQLWGATTTEIDQRYSSGPSPEVHQGAVYWVVGTETFDTSGYFTLSSQSYVSPRHEDVEFPAMAAGGSYSQDGGNGKAIITFTLSGNGGPTGADNGGFYPSTAYGRLTSTSNGLLESEINIADLGRSPQDGFTEYLGYPGPTRPRWGDYSWAIFLPWSGGRIYFATNYIQYPNCLPPEFSDTLGTCDGTRNYYTNWGTSVNYVVP